MYLTWNKQTNLNKLCPLPPPSKKKNTVENFKTPTWLTSRGRKRFKAPQCSIKLPCPLIFLGDFLWTGFWGFLLGRNHVFFSQTKLLKFIFTLYFLNHFEVWHRNVKVNISFTFDPYMPKIRSCHINRAWFSHLLPAVPACKYLIHY